MVCIHCGNETKVTNSRPQRRANQVWRRRQCLSCKAIFTTEEALDYSQAWLVENKNGLHPFSRDTLFLSIYQSVRHRDSAAEDAAALTQTVMHRLLSTKPSNPISSRTIADIAQVALNRFDTAASVQYAAFHK